MTTLVSGRVQFKNAAKKAGIAIETKKNRDYRNAFPEVVSVRDAEFNAVFHWDESDGAVPAYFRLSNMNDNRKIRLVQAGFQSRYAVEELWFGESVELVEYWFLPKAGN